MKDIGIIGASGFTGAELLRLLSNHPQMNVKVATGDTMAGERVCDLYPSLAVAYPDMEFSELNIAEITGLEAVFCALPHGLSQMIMPDLLQNSQTIVDLGSDFRLKNPEDYIDWYGAEHTCPEYLQQAVYGLPELFRDKIVGAELIAATGCNAAASVLSLIHISEPTRPY